MVGLLLLVAGAAMTAIGIVRARGPWARYQALKAQEDNIARYESWRGGLRDSGPTGASVAMDLYRRQARDGAILIGAGAVMAIAGLLLR
jgi:hypothetical protein